MARQPARRAHLGRSVPAAPGAARWHSLQPRHVQAVRPQPAESEHMNDMYARVPPVYFPMARRLNELVSRQRWKAAEMQMSSIEDLLGIQHPFKTVLQLRST